MLSLYANKTSRIDPRDSRHLYYPFALNTLFRSARLVSFQIRRLAERRKPGIYEIKLKALNQYEQS